MKKINDQNMYTSRIGYTKKLFLKFIATLFLVLLAIACNSSKTLSSSGTEFDLSFIDKKAKESFIDSDGNLIIEDKVLDRYVKKALLLSSDDNISIQKVQEIKTLKLNAQRDSDTGEKIKNIDALSYFTNLEKLELKYNSIKDITPLQNLKKLTYLNLLSNNVRDISVLKELVNLKEINFYKNQVTSLKSISNLRKLERINFWDNGLMSIKALKELDNLKSVNVGNNLITDISPLSGKNKLEDLWLNMNKLQNAEVISACKDNLKTLGLGCCGLTDINFLQDCIKLENLLIFSNNINDISALQKLTSLNVLIANHNQIRDISVLAILVNNGAFNRKGIYNRERNNIDLSDNDIDLELKNNQKALKFIIESAAKVKL